MTVLFDSFNKYLAINFAVSLIFALLVAVAMKYSHSHPFAVPLYVFVVVFSVIALVYFNMCKCEDNKERYDGYGTMEWNEKDMESKFKPVDYKDLGAMKCEGVC